MFVNLIVKHGHGAQKQGLAVYSASQLGIFHVLAVQLISLWYLANGIDG